MPLLTLLARDTCILCGCRLRGFTIGTYRINKHSLKSPRGGLSYIECPECGPTHARVNPLGVRPICNQFRPDEKSQAIIDRHHERKGWPTWPTS